MPISRDDLKKKRLQAMGVVGREAQASADMYDRVIQAGTLVASARDLAEKAHNKALSEQLSDLKEMAEELEDFAQSAPTAGGSGTPAPAVKPSASSAALDALNAARPNPKPDFGTEGNAYVGTRP